jgi:SAM-dependent methyltransferase
MGDYLLGHGDREWDRLEEQHRLWWPWLRDALKVEPDFAILEVGCGTGALLEALAGLLGPDGRLDALERDPRAAAASQERLGARARVVAGDLLGEPPDLPPGTFDLVVVRWVFSFLPDPGQALRRIHGWLRPGGRLMVQDYHHDGLRLDPPTPAFDVMVAAVRRAYADQGGDLWVAPKLPGCFADAGFQDIRCDPVVRAGGPDSPWWRWVGRFLVEHADTVVASGHLSPAQRDAFRAAWEARAGDPRSSLVTPIQMLVQGRRSPQ